jgi:basic membrane protein A and related proteins
VDADQAYLGPQVFTSALKKVDVAVVNAIKGVQEDKYTGGQDVINSVKSGGIGYGKLNTAASKYADQVKQVQDQIASGEISDIPDTVKGS